MGAPPFLFRPAFSDRQGFYDGIIIKQAALSGNRKSDLLYFKNKPDVYFSDFLLLPVLRRCESRDQLEGTRKIAVIGVSHMSGNDGNREIRRREEMF